MAADGTAALVVALSAQLSKFENDMKRAGDIADRSASDIENRFSKLNPTFAGSFLGNFLGNISTTALEKIIDIIKEAKDRFIDLGKVSEQVGESMSWIYGVQEAAGKLGAPVDDVTKSVRNLALQLDEMQRGGTNGLSKLLDANPAVLQGITRDALTLQDAIRITGDLYQNTLKPIEKLDLAKQLGQSESLSKFYSQGGDQVLRLTKAASDAAPDLDKLRQSAIAFDEAWKAAVEHVKAYIASDLVDEARDALSKFADFALSVLSLMKGGLLDRPEGFGLNWVQPAIDKWSGLKQVLDATKGAASAAAAAVEGGAEKGGVPLPTSRPLDAPDLRRPATRVPVSGGSSSSDSDAVDRAITSLNKHIEATDADAAAVGQGAAALARFRAEAAETAAVQANGGKETAKQAEAFKLLQDRAEAAAAALAQAKIDSQISFGKQTALLSDSDASIAQRLTAKFGNDVPAAMASSEAAALRFNDALHQISSSIDSDLTSGLADIVSGTKSVSDGFTAMAASILRDIEKIVIQSAIVQPLMRGLSSAFGGAAGFNPFAGLTGHADGGLISGPGGPRSDNILARLSPGEFVVNAEATARNRDLLDAINSGKRGFADGGYVGMPTLPSPIARQSAGSVSISVINNAGVKVQAQQVMDGRGNRGVQLTLDDAVASSLSRPGSATRSAMRNNFGASPVGVRR